MPTFSSRQSAKRPRSPQQSLNRVAALSLETLESRILLTSDPVLSFTALEPIDEGGTVNVAFNFSDMVESGTSSVGLNPADFLGNSTANGVFDPAVDVTIDTDTLEITETISGNLLAMGETEDVDDGFEPYQIAVFAFEDFELDAGIKLRATGLRPLALLSQMDVDISGTIDVSAESRQAISFALESVPGAGGGQGGLGGLNGKDGFRAAGAPDGSAGQLGTGGALGGASGSGGGSFGNGQAGSIGLPASGSGSGGIGYLNLLNLIQGGSGGSASGRNFNATTDNFTVFGGSGGGGIEIGALGSVSISTTGEILANGSNGYDGVIRGSGNGTGGGGGAGGGILVHGTNITQDGSLSARGGNGGNGLQVGGGGSGGQILLAYSATGTFVENGDRSVDAGSGNQFAGVAEDGDENTIVLTGTPIVENYSFTINWGDGSTADTGSDSGGEITVTPGSPGGPDTTGSFNGTHSYVDDGVFTVEVTLTDTGGGSVTELFDVTVNNVAPEITSLTTSSQAIGGAEQGETVTLSADFTDVGTLDTHTAVIDWGDGSTSVGIVDQNTGTVSGDHVYANGGLYEVTLTLTDDDTGEAVEVTSAVIAGVGLNDGVLEFVGTNGDDRVKVFKSSQDEIQVQYRFGDGTNQTESFAAGDVDRLVYYLGDGDDVGFVSNQIDLPVTMFGGAGHDMLLGGNGNDSLLGGDGDDTLVGRSGDDLLIGGDGADMIIGQGGEDILISGTTSYDNSLSAIDSIMEVWTSGDDYETRVANITDQNQAVFLVADITVFDDDDADALIGGRDKDLYFANLEGGTEDFVAGLRNSEFVEELEIV